jgi:hypothetical protein
MSEMIRSGDSERAAASASNGQVKNLTEKPFICNIAARLAAMTVSSSTTKMHELERGDTWSLFREFLRLRQACEGFIWNQYVLLADQNSVQYCSHLWVARLDRQHVVQMSAQGRCQYGWMRKRGRQPKGPARGKPKRPARTTTAGIKGDMREPRLTKSVRDDPRHQVALADDEPTRPG